MDVLSAILESFRGYFIDFLPRLFSVLLILAAGIALAFLVRILTRTFMCSTLRLLESKTKSFRTLIPPQREKLLASMLPGLFFWLIIILALAVTSEVLGLPLFSAWLTRLIIYVPHILMAIFVIIAGLIGGSFIKDLVTKMAYRLGIPRGDILGRAAQVITLITAGVIASSQLGIDITFLTNFLFILVGAFLFGSAIAFGMGANTSIRNILACFYLRKHVEIGNRVKVGDVEGVIAEISPTHVILDSDEGRILIPGKLFAEKMTLIVRSPSE